MLKKAMVSSGLVMASAGLASLTSAGVAYLLDPKLGERRRNLLRKRAQAFFGQAESIGETASQNLRRETEMLSHKVGQLADWAKAQDLWPRQRASRTLPLAAAGVGFSVGMGLIYFLDPQHGHARRVALHDSWIHTMRAFMVRTGGLLHRSSVEDAKLAENVRAVIGYVSTHPASINIQASHGTITLHGSVRIKNNLRDRR